jgi:hypothetical protein
MRGVVGELRLGGLHITLREGVPLPEKGSTNLDSCAFEEGTAAQERGRGGHKLTNLSV